MKAYGFVPDVFVQAEEKQELRAVTESHESGLM